MMQHLQYCQLTVLVPLILEYFLYCNCLAGLGNGGFENDAKGAISNDFLGVIGHALCGLNRSGYLKKMVIALTCCALPPRLLSP